MNGMFTCLINRSTGKNRSFTCRSISPRNQTNRKGRTKLDDYYLGAHRFSSKHRKQLEKDNICGCFYCTRIFYPAEIDEWIDNNDTALCPYCGMDSVIGESSGFPITDQFLKEMHREFFM